MSRLNLYFILTRKMLSITSMKDHTVTQEGTHYFVQCPKNIRLVFTTAGVQQKFYCLLNCFNLPLHYYSAMYPSLPLRFNIPSVIVLLFVLLLKFFIALILCPPIHDCRWRAYSRGTRGRRSWGSSRWQCSVTTSHSKPPNTRKPFASLSCTWSVMTN